MGKHRKSENAQQAKNSLSQFEGEESPTMRHAHLAETLRLIEEIDPAMANPPDKIVPDA